MRKNVLKGRESAIALGKFDGIHAGHRMLIDRLLQEKNNGYATIVFTFTKTPSEVINNQKKQHLLTENEKKMFMEKLGIDLIYQYESTEKNLSMEPLDFLENVLIKQFNVKRIVCGSDFRFGHDRRGDVGFLIKNEKKYGYKTIVLDKLKYMDKDISSTMIRECIKAGDIKLANRLLKYPYTVIGKVVEGMKLGRKMGIPTANITPDSDKLLPPNGVYFTLADINNKTYKGVTNIGCRPTVSGENINIETHFLSFDGDLYGKTIELRFYEYVRKEEKFDSIEKLTEEINNNIKQCESWKMP